MASNYRIERARGTKESARQLALLRDKWPLAFPIKDQDVRPLAAGVAREIAAVMGWPQPHTLGVLKSWKMEPVYCHAVICYDQRIRVSDESAFGLYGYFGNNRARVPRKFQSAVLFGRTAL
jgi:hypothetical protein